MNTMFLPLLLNLVCAYGINLSTLAFVGHLGTDTLAAAALGTSIVGMLGRTVLFGLVGGLDTVASQVLCARQPEGRAVQ
jgi:MATE family multidrug resistance protein